MLVLALNISGEQKPVPFADVKHGDWYYTYVRTAYSCGIITGMESDMFQRRDPRYPSGYGGNGCACFECGS